LLAVRFDQLAPGSALPEPPAVKRSRAGDSFFDTAAGRGDLHRATFQQLRYIKKSSLWSSI